MRTLDQEEIGEAAWRVAHKLYDRYRDTEFQYLYGVPRGGVPAAYAVGHHLARISSMEVKVVDSWEDANIVVDDLIDSGKTRERFKKPFAALFAKHDIRKGRFDTLTTFAGAIIDPQTWVIFPWEGSLENSAEDIVTRFLQFIGEDPARGGLRETPARVLKAWRDEWFSGYRSDPKEILKQFEDGAEKYDEMIIVRDIPVYTHCEHHIAPFFGHAHVAYIPNGRIVGLSKIARLVDVFARRLQVQERLTAQIADALMDHLGAKGASVVLKCRHLCMESRGIRAPGTSTVTSVMRGAMLNNVAARAEMLALIGER